MSRSSDRTSQQQKLAILIQAEGFADENALIEACLTDSVCPAICMAIGCDHIAEMEPDQTQGYCEACGGRSVTSALVLAGVI